MQPALDPGQLVVGTGLYKDLKAGDVIVFKHDGLEKIKRISKIEHGHLYVVGDNPKESTDSRKFGWITQGYVVGKVVWPRSIT